MRDMESPRKQKKRRGVEVDAKELRRRRRREVLKGRRKINNEEEEGS